MKDFFIRFKLNGEFERKIIPAISPEVAAKILTSSVSILLNTSEPLNKSEFEILYIIPTDSDDYIKRIMKADFEDYFIRMDKEEINGQ